MATVKFQVLSGSTNSSIYLRLSLGRGKTPRCKTGLFINSSDWSSVKGLPKQSSAANKNLSLDLNNLEIHILKEVNRANSVGILISNGLKQGLMSILRERMSPK